MVIYRSYYIIYIRFMFSADLLEIYKRLWSYTRSRWKFLGIAVFGMVIYSLTNAALVALLKPLMDEGLFQQGMAEFPLWIAIITIVVILVTRGVGNFLSVYYIGYVGGWVVKDLRAKMMRHLLYLPATYFDTHRHGIILSRFTYDCEQISTLASKVLMYAVRDSLTLIAVAAWLFYLQPLLCSLVLLISIPISYVMRLANQRFRRFARNTQELYGKISGNVQQVISSNTMVKAANAQAYEYQGFEGNNELLRRKKMRTVQTRASNVPIVMILAGFSLVIVIYFAKAETLLETMSPGTLVSFMAAIIVLFRPLRNLASMNATLQQGLTAAASVFQFLDEPLEINEGKRMGQTVQGNIRFKQVFFRYPDSNRDTLHDINLDISAGEAVALVGHSGAGKTSLVNLLLRLYEAGQGSIEIDGQDIREFDLYDLRTRISFVGQGPSLIHGSITENITYGLSSSPEAVEAAAQQAHALEFIRNLSQGFDTVVTNDLLSGGQIQRLAIARALLRDAAILIFDEVTASLDSVSEKYIKTALREIMQNRTVIIIAHRFSTIDFVNKIVVLDDGGIVGVGSHAMLLDSCPVYSNLYRNQTPQMLIP